MNKLLEKVKLIEISENGIQAVFGVCPDGCAKLLHLSKLPFLPERIQAETLDGAFNLCEINLSGYDRPLERHGTKYIVTAPGYRMKYKSHEDSRDEVGRLLKFVLEDKESGIEVICNYRFFDGIAAIRTWCEVVNVGSQTQTLEYISTFNYTGIEKEGIAPRDEKMRVMIPHNSWQREMCWESYTLKELGIPQSQRDSVQRSSKAVGATNTGNWSAKSYLPMGYVENTVAGSGLCWQIEHNGSWHWEISDQLAHLYLAISGPTETESHWFKTLKPGDRFVTVPAGLTFSDGNHLFERAIGEMTKYRRRIRRKNDDNESLAVIFNDYMNCLWADPTTEKELPLIDAAAEAGCEYFCIDAGWYAKGFWWDSVGEWQESRERFPNGVKEVTDYIRSKGMIPGVWLEIEVMGINCELAAKMSDDCFFMRHGKRVYDRSRYQLDFRNPAVRKHADDTIDRLVREYGIGYIKMDYNIEPGIGTEINADSVGDGMLGHERAYLAWLDGVFERHPDLIIENCSSGGLRIDYALLSRHSIQSTSDQEDYKRYATIAANAPAGLTPEQSAIWSYPLSEGDREEVVFNMVNAMLMRIHQSGHLVYLSPERKALVKEAIGVYKEIRQDIKKAVPFWGMGLSAFDDGWASMGLDAGHCAYVAVWRRDGAKDAEISLDYLESCSAVKCIYPSYAEDAYELVRGGKALRVRFEKEFSARLFKIEYGGTV